MTHAGALLLVAGSVVFAAFAAYDTTPGPNHDPAASPVSDLAKNDRGDASFIPSFVPSANIFARSSSEAGAAPVALASSLKPSVWTTVVAAADADVTPVQSRSADPATRYQLALDLQRELQRVGCYQGELTGVWNAATRRAMSTFMDRANARLPVDKPDYVLLALVKSHSESACAMTCPPRQSIGASGRCVPNAVVAQEARRTKRQEEKRLAQARLEAARAAAAPAVEVASSAAPVVREQLPWLQADAQSSAGAGVGIGVNAVGVQAAGQQNAGQREPLPGRMGIGGPQTDPLDDAKAPSPPVIYAPLDPVRRYPGDQGSSSDGANPAAVASLQVDPDADDPAADPAQALATPLDAPDGRKHKSQKSHKGEREVRVGREYYGYSGRRRKGDPRPGTSRFNLMQSLGGIY
jgi:hypothetical protein